MKARAHIIRTIIFTAPAAIALLAAWISLPSLRAQIKTALPDFISPITVQNSRFTCTDNRSNRTGFTSNPEMHDVVWREAMVYLKNLAVAMSTTDRFCRNSDIATYETGRAKNNRSRTMCLMDRQDTRDMVNEIYAILENQDAAKKCFSLNASDTDVYSPGGQLVSQSRPAQYQDRSSLKDFFEALDIDDVQQHGLGLANHFSEILTGSDIMSPKAFPSDVSARALPNLWASVGWIPMYAKKEGRFKTNQPSARGGFVYAEVLGTTGLLRIKEINGNPVKAEIGMTAQKLDSFYTFHTHDATEIYYSIKKPSCASEVQVFAMREGNPLIKTIKQEKNYRIIEFDANSPAIKDHFWLSSSPLENDLTYYHENTIHALKVSDECSKTPKKSGAVAVWARPSSFDSRNPNYADTNICESAKREGAPADAEEIVRCRMYNWTF